MSKIKAIVFDWGGVLAEDIFPEIIAYCARKLDVSAEKLEPVFKKYHHPLLVNDISEHKFWTKITADLGIDKAVHPSLLSQAFASRYKPKEEVWALAGKLSKRGYLLGLVSDAEIPAIRHFFEQDYLIFDARVFSAMVKTEKPGRKIYELLLAELGTKPEETVFFDDMPDNVAAAREMGMHAFRFEGAEQVRARLMELGVII